MSSIKEQAAQFVDACDSGKGWAACQQYCHPDATFSAQAGALADVSTLESYTEWAKGLLTPMPDARYVATDYVYVMEFDGDQIRHVTKIWNDAFALQQLGWA